MAIRTFPHIVGDQEPRILHLPIHSIELLEEMDYPEPGEAAIRLAKMAGLKLDPWQKFAMRKSCSLRDDQTWNPYNGRYEYKWAAMEVGLMLSRQNGKGGFLEARELAGLFLFGEELLIHSAHKFDTSRQHFSRISGLIESTPSMMKEVMRIPHGHGEEGVELKNGQTLQFRTRGGSGGGGRGFSCDCLVLDEAMFLGAQMISDLMPTLSARRNPQIFYTGSAGGKESTQFGRIRARALAAIDQMTKLGLPLEEIESEAERLLYMEWSAELCNMFCGPDCEIHDDPSSPYVWAKANPGYGIRLFGDYIHHVEFSSMIPEEFNKERLGVGDWPTDGDNWKVIPKDFWDHQHDETSIINTKPFVMGVDTSPDRSWSCITMCGKNERGEYHVEITGRDELDYRPGTQWVVQRVKDIWDRVHPEFVVIDRAGQAGSFVDKLEALGIKVVSPNSREYAQACGEFGSGIVPRHNEEATIVHIGQEELSKAVAGADTRKLTDMWAWSKSDSAADISPLVSVTLAYWGYAKFIHAAPAAADPWVYRR